MSFKNLNPVWPKIKTFKLKIERAAARRAQVEVLHIVIYRFELLQNKV